MYTINPYKEKLSNIIIHTCYNISKNDFAETVRAVFFTLNEFKSLSTHGYNNFFCIREVTRIGLRCNGGISHMDINSVIQITTYALIYGDYMCYR